MGRIIAIANQKGGVGKTTTAINLSACLAEAGKKVLVIDLDPQGNTTSGLGIDKSELENTVYELILDQCTAKEAMVRTDIENLYILPSNVNLAGAEIELLDIDNKEYTLREAIDYVQEEFEYIIIDCPPSLGLLTLNAMMAADSVITPVQCEYYALEGLAHFMNTVAKIKQFLHPKLKMDGGLLTMYDARMNLSKQVFAEVSRYFGDQVYKTPIPRNIRLAEAPSFGQSIFNYDPACRGANAYIQLAIEFLVRRGADANAYKDFKMTGELPVNYDFGG